MSSPNLPQVRIKVVGVGGAGGNAVARMAKSRLDAVEFLALNTDVQVLRQLRGVPTLAIGPAATGGMGSGGHPEIGRKAIKESQGQVTEAIEGTDLVFVTAGLGGGTGTGAASIVADVARRHGALTVGVVTMPFSFEGPVRRSVAEEGLRQFGQRVDTLITVENDRLLPSLKGKVTLEKAFQLADEVLRQGVQGISELITVPGLINVDFADVRALMSNGGPSFMGLGEGQSQRAAVDAAQMALSNALFDGPLDGATGVLLNVRGGKDLTLGQVHDVAGIIRKSINPTANVIFGVVQDRKMSKRVAITLVATGIADVATGSEVAGVVDNELAVPGPELADLPAKPATNGHSAPVESSAGRML